MNQHSCTAARLARRATLLWVLMLPLPTSELRACPVCAGTTRQDQQTAKWVVLGSTFGMIALPLIMVGGFAVWLSRQR